MSDSKDLHKNPHANIQLPKLERTITAEQERLENEQSLRNVVAGKEDSGVSAHKPMSSEQEKKAHVSDKLYFFPESYNMLRFELVNHWPKIWPKVSWAMAFKADYFVEVMNKELSLNLLFDSQRVGATCATYLNELRARRGVSPLAFDY